ncbi:MAG: hypothetical protein HY547_00535 [Elusimicrobia bacterium]|nr:hypothetical protein [Elusimicrobiota bacterium]
MSRAEIAMNRLRQTAIKRRIKLNRVMLAALLLFMTHPRSHVFFFFGLMIALAGSLLRLWARLALDDAGGELQQSGPYQIVRHPLYLGTILQAVGMWVACFSFRKVFSFGLLGFILVAYFLFIYKEAILLEEEGLSLRWPKNWDCYMMETPALIPKADFLDRLDWSHWRWSKIMDMPDSRELRNFMACLGAFAVLWLKLIYYL